MMKSHFNLLVIRSADAPRAVGFYEALGLDFVQHAHGQGPQHYAHEDNGFVFEIYPLADHLPTTSTRLGFRVSSFKSTIADLLSAGGTVVSAPKDSPWGRRAVLTDLDGHKVELLESD